MDALLFGNYAGKIVPPFREKNGERALKVEAPGQGSIHEDTVGGVLFGNN